MSDKCSGWGGGGGGNGHAPVKLILQVIARIAFVSCRIEYKLDRSNHHAMFCKSGKIIRNTIQCEAGRNVVRRATYSERETLQARHELSLFSGLFLLLTLFIHCFPNNPVRSSERWRVASKLPG